MTREIVNCVERVTALVPGERLVAAALFDLHTRDMLVLFPSIAVTHERAATTIGQWDPSTWPWHCETSWATDLLVARLTASAGSGGQSWQQIFERFLEAVVNACRAATDALVAAGVVADDFVVVAVDEVDGDGLVGGCLTDEQLKRHFPRIDERRREIERMRTLPVDQQLSAIVGSGRGPIDDPAVSDALELSLADHGPDASDALAVLLMERPVDLSRWRRSVCLAEIVGQPTPALVDALTATLSDVDVPSTVHGDAASALAWLGCLDVVVPRLGDFPRETAVEVVGRPYLGDRKLGPLDYGLLEEVLRLWPEMDDALLARVSPFRMYAIDGGDVPTAMQGLGSEWAFVRRHASIVMLTMHV